MKTQDTLKDVKGFICTLGTRVKTGEANFIKVDKTIPGLFADLGKSLGVPHYGLLTSRGASSGSCLLYMRTKGQAEDLLKGKGIPSLAIYQPGLITERDGDWRCCEALWSKCACFPHITGANLGKAIL